MTGYGTCYVCHEFVHETPICSCTGSIAVHRACVLKLNRTSCSVCRSEFAINMTLEKTCATLTLHTDGLKTRLACAKIELRQAARDFIALRAPEHALRAMKHLVIHVVPALYGMDSEEIETEYAECSTLLDQAGRPRDAVTFLQHGIAIKRNRLGDSLEVATGEIMLGRKYFAMNAHGNAQAAFKSALKTLESIHTRPHIDTAVAAHELGTSYFAAGDHDSAIKSYQVAAQLYRALDPWEHARTLHDMGIAWQALGNSDAALECFELSTGVAVPDPTIYNRMGKIYYERGALENAMQMYKKEKTCTNDRITGDIALVMDAIRIGDDEALRALEGHFELRVFER